MNTKDIHILPRIICEIGIVSTGIEIGIVSTGIGIGVIITGVNTCPSCDEGLLIGEADELDEVLEAVRLGEARAVPGPPFEAVPVDELLGDGVRVDVLFDLALNLLLL